MFRFNMNMGIGIEPKTIRFFENKGIKFFDGFNATIKDKKPVKVFFGPNPDNNLASILVTNQKGDRLGFYDLSFKKDKSLMEGVQIFSDKEGENVGEVLTLAALIEFSKNRLNNFKFFSLKESLPFHARFGFIIDNDDPNYILNGLKHVMKSKLQNVDEIKRNAAFFYPKIKHSEDYLPQDKFLLQRGCKVISDYFKFLGRHGLKKLMPDMVNGTDVKFTDWEFETNRNFLNPLMKEHEIDYQF